MASVLLLLHPVRHSESQIMYLQNLVAIGQNLYTRHFNSSDHTNNSNCFLSKSVKFILIL